MEKVKEVVEYGGGLELNRNGGGRGLAWLKDGKIGTISSCDGEEGFWQDY